MMELDLRGKVAVVTGATGGWGSGSAFALAARGATVVLSARTQSKLDALAARIADEAGHAVGLAADIRTDGGAQQLVARAVAQFGRVDVLVNCAGVTRSDVPPDVTSAGLGALYGGGILETTERAWDEVIAAELSAVFRCTKAAATQMVAQGDGGAIISVVGTILGAAGQGAHAAAKGGLLNGIWSWSDELRPHRITVNGVRGYVRSKLTDPSFDLQTYDYRNSRDRSELPTEPLDAGELVAWLASPDAADVTGAYIGIDGPRLTVWEPNLPATSVWGTPPWRAEDLRSSFGPILRRRPPRPTMVDVVRDLFSARDRARATGLTTDT